MAQEKASTSKAGTQSPPAVSKVPGKVAPTKPLVAVLKTPIKPAASRKIKKSSASVPEMPVGVAKPAKIRLVHEKFTMPANEHVLIRALKNRCMTNGVAARKSDLIRAAIICLADLEEPALLVALQRLAPRKNAKTNRKR